MPYANLISKLERTVKTELSKQKKEQFNYLQNFLYFFADPLFSYADSVVALVERGHLNAAEIILRSMVESHININYHIVGNSQKKLATTARELFDERLKGLNGLQPLLNKYPKLQSKVQTSILSLQGLQNAIDHQLTHRAAVLRANDIPDTREILSLRKKAEMADQETGEHGTFGKLYEVEYRLFSQPAHMNISGLQSFVPGDEIEEAKRPKSHAPYTGTALDICVAYTKDLYDQNVITGPRTDVIREIEVALTADSQRL